MLKYARLCLWALGLGLAVPVAQAAADQTWVAAEGGDYGTCASIQPCATLAYAINQTVAGGTISVMDTGNYGPVTITRPVTIRSDLGTAQVITSIRIVAGPTDRILLLGLDLEGRAAGSSYAYGVRVEQAADVMIQNCRINDYTGDASNGAAVQIVPTSAARVTLDGVTLFNNTMGVLVSNGTGGAGHLKLYRSLLLTNPAAGVRVAGSGNDALLVGTIILGSTKALDIGSGAVIKSYGDNVLTSGDAPTLVPKN